MEILDTVQYYPWTLNSLDDTSWQHCGKEAINSGADYLIKKQALKTVDYWLNDLAPAQSKTNK